MADRQNVSFRTSAHAGVGISIEFQAAHRHTGVLTCHSPKFIHEKWCFYPGDCHTSDIGHWFAMTGNSINSNLSHCCVNPISILYDYRVRGTIIVNFQLSILFYHTRKDDDNP